jgi:hypothetical protein
MRCGHGYPLISVSQFIDGPILNYILGIVLINYQIQGLVLWILGCRGCAVDDESDVIGLLCETTPFIPHQKLVLVEWAMWDIMIRLPYYLSIFSSIAVPQKNLPSSNYQSKVLQFILSSAPHYTGHPHNTIMGLFGRSSHAEPTSTATHPVAQDPRRSSGLFGSRRTSSPTNGTTSGTTNGRSGFLHRDTEDASVTAARERVIAAETAERNADRALMSARAAVREAREQVKRIEREAAEE